MRLVWHRWVVVAALAAPVVCALGGCEAGTSALLGDASRPADAAGGAGDGGAASPDGAAVTVPEVIFTDISARSGLPAASTMCLVFRDLDGDGRADLLLAGLDGNGLFGGSLDLWRGRGDGTFTRTPIPVPLNAVSGCRAMDWSGDGVVDLVATGGYGRQRRVAFLEGRGGGVFAEVTREVFADSLAQPAFVGLAPPELVDLDGDRRPDLVLGNFAWPEPGQSRGCLGPCLFSAHDFLCRFDDPVPVRQAPLLYRNVDGRRFERVVAAGLRAEETSVLAAVDWDGDGRAELAAANDFGRNALYRVEGGARFSDLLAGWPDNPENHGMGLAFADFDADGRLDAYVADLGPDRLLFGTADGRAIDRAGPLGIEAATRLHSGWSPLAEDWNGDGRVDLFVANSALAASDDELIRFGAGCNAPPGMGTARTQADFVLVNRLGAGQGFSVQELLHPETRPMALRAGAAAADLDGDGDLDVVSLIETQRASLHLYRNDSPGAAARMLAVRLAGARPGVDLTATLVVALREGREVGRRVLGAGGSLGDSAPELRFGLGDASSVDTLEVRWPTGRRQSVPGPHRAGALVTITEEP